MQSWVYSFYKKLTRPITNQKNLYLPLRHSRLNAVFWTRKMHAKYMQLLQLHLGLFFYPEADLGPLS